MAEPNEPDFNRSALTVKNDQVWYTGQRAERIPSGLVRVVGNDCTSLDLSYNELTSISSARDYVNLQQLILDNNKLRDLKTLPKMPTLTTLSLNNNKSGILYNTKQLEVTREVVFQSGFLTLSTVSRKNNLTRVLKFRNKVLIAFSSVLQTIDCRTPESIKVTDIDEALERIKESCPSIVYVSLLGNPGYPDQLTENTTCDEADYERYRLYAIHTLPNTLRFLDSRQVTEREIIDARNRGHLLRTVKLAPRKITELTGTGFDEIDTILDVNYTPLPQSQRKPQDHIGAYGKCRYRYSGKNSEGNRFICNNDL